MDRRDFTGSQVYSGLDLASKIDIASRIDVYQRTEDDGRIHYYMFGQHYLPEDTIETSPNASYAGWAIDGHLTETPGNVIDYDWIESDIEELSRKDELVEVGFDPHQATQLSSHLLDKGIPMVEVRPTVLNFSEPMKELEKLVMEGRLHHTGDPVLEWMVSNVVCHTDAKDNIYPRKEFPENKIDGVVAAIMALSRALVATNTAPGVYIL